MGSDTGRNECLSSATVSSRALCSASFVLGVNFSPQVQYTSILANLEAVKVLGRFATDVMRMSLLASACMSVCLSACLRVTFRLPLNDFFF